MKILIHELKFQLKSSLIWGLGMGAIIAIGMMKFQAMASDPVAIADMLKIIPHPVQVVMNINEMTIASPAGFFAVISNYLLLLITIHSIMLGTKLVGHEIKDKTIEFLFVKPVSKTKIILNKYGAGIIILIFVNLIIFISTYSILMTFDQKTPLSEIFMFNVGFFIIQVLCMSLGFMMTSLFKQVKVAMLVATSFVMASYLLAIFGDLLEIIWMKYFSIFKYFSVMDVIDHRFNYLQLAISIFIIITSIIISIKTYQN